MAYYIPGPGISIGTVSNGGTFTFPASYFTNSGNKYLLFEGAGIGAGELRLTISQGTNVLAQTSTWLDFRDVKNMYEQVRITGVNNSVPPTNFLSSGYQQLNWVDSGSDGDTNVIVFVHGWRMGVWDYYNFSESMFKRLYWQGYRGRFITIRWDTLSKDDFKFASTLQSFLTYNSSEYRAWESAKGVSDYLTYLKQERFPNYNINVCSHSMGGVVMAEALKLQLAGGQQNVDNYVLMQVAVPASCYDTSFTNYAPLLAAEASHHTPNTYLGYPGDISGAVNGRLVNFYNTNDYALATGTLPIVGTAVSWEANQKNYKPDAGFGYSTDGTNSWRGFTLMTDSREIMSFVARPRSKAVGAQPGVEGVIQGGSVDLKGNYGFDVDRNEHSAQFNWNIQRLSGFYAQLLDKLLTSQNP
jgi:pimeloyl-ACP methyl ester carboxylesterase